MNTNTQIENGLQSYKDFCELSLLEELPDWVADILSALNDGNITPLLGEKYEPWVIGVYYRLKAEGTNKKPNSIK